MLVEIDDAVVVAVCSTRCVTLGWLIFVFECGFVNALVIMTEEFFSGELFVVVVLMGWFLLCMLRFMLCSCSVVIFLWILGCVKNAVTFLVIFGLMLWIVMRFLVVVFIMFLMCL